MRNLLFRFLKDNSASSTVEYLMAAALIATSLLALMPYLGAAVLCPPTKACTFTAGVVACE